MLCKCDYYRGLSVIKPCTINASGSLDSFSSLQHEHVNGHASIHEWIYIFVICIYHCIFIVLSPLIPTMGLEKKPWYSSLPHSQKVYHLSLVLWTEGQSRSFEAVFSASLPRLSVLFVSSFICVPLHTSSVLANKKHFCWKKIWFHS